jgi:hypothetical protein
MTLLNVFVGVPQSRYAAIAILVAILVVSLSIVFGNDPVPLSQKFAFVFMIFLVSLPGLLLSLFQLTCMVVGAGAKNQRPWCSIYAWIVSILLIVYSALLIVMAVMTITSRSKVLSDIALVDAERFTAKNQNKELTAAAADQFAADMMKANVEHFEGAQATKAQPALSKFDGKAGGWKETPAANASAPSPVPTPAPVVQTPPSGFQDMPKKPMTPPSGFYAPKKEVNMMTPPSGFEDMPKKNISNFKVLGTSDTPSDANFKAAVPMPGFPGGNDPVPYSDGTLENFASLPPPKKGGY